MQNSTHWDVNPWWLSTPIFNPSSSLYHLFLLCHVWTLLSLRIQSVTHFYSTDWNTKAFHCCTNIIKFPFPFEMYCLIFWTFNAVNRLQLCFCCVQSGFVAAMQLFQRAQQKSQKKSHCLKMIHLAFLIRFCSFCQRFQHVQLCKDELYGERDRAGRYSADTDIFQFKCPFCALLHNLCYSW